MKECKGRKRKEKMKETRHAELKNVLKNKKINSKLGMIFVHRGLNIGQNAGRNQIQHRRNKGSSFHRDRKGRRQLNTGNKHMTEEE